MDDDEAAYWIRIGHIAGATAIANELVARHDECKKGGGPCDECLAGAITAQWIIQRVMEQAATWGIGIIPSAPSTDTLQ